MLIIEVNRSEEKPAQRKLFSDPTCKIVGFHQNSYAGRQIILVHTARTWDESHAGRRPVNITEDIDYAITCIGQLAKLLRSAATGGGSAHEQHVNAIAHGNLAISRLRAMQAGEMTEPAGKYFIVTEKEFERRRLKREGGAATVVSPPATISNESPAVPGKT